MFIEKYAVKLMILPKLNRHLLWRHFKEKTTTFFMIEISKIDDINFEEKNLFFLKKNSSSSSDYIKKR